MIRSKLPWGKGMSSNREKSSNERANGRVEGEGDRLADVDVDEIQNWFADQAEKCDANFIVPKSAADNGVALSIFGYGSR